MSQGAQRLPLCARGFSAPSPPAQMDFGGEPGAAMLSPSRMGSAAPAPQVEILQALMDGVLTDRGLL